MRVFLVRVKETKELVGIYAAETLDRLADLVDEVTDPHECEYTSMPEGGIYWNAGAPLVPAEWPEETEAEQAEDPIDWAEVQLCDGWGDPLYGWGRGRKRTWRDVPHSPVCDAINAWHTRLADNAQ